MVLIMISLGLFVTSAHAVIYEFNYTNINPSVSFPSYYFDVETGNVSLSPNNFSDFKLGNGCWGSENNALTERVRGDITTDISYVQYSNLSNCAGFGSVYGTTGQPDRWIFVIKLPSNRYAIFQTKFNGTYVGGYPYFDAVSYYQDDSTKNFPPYTIAKNFNGSYVFYNTSDTYLGVSANGGIDIVYGYQYDRFWYNSPYYNVYFYATFQNIIGTANGFTFNYVDGYAQSVDCAGINYTFSSTGWDLINATYCVKSPDGKIYKVWASDVINNLYFNNLTFYSELLNITAPPQPSFETGLIQGTDVTKTYFSFETTDVGSTQTNNSDFLYDSTLNPNVLAPLLHSDGMNFLTYSNTYNNDLASWDCSLDSPFGYTAKYVYDVPTYSPTIWCFNVTTANGQTKTYGAIKIIANTNIRSGIAPEFDFYYAIYRSTYISFTNVAWTPSTPVANLPLTVTWTTSVPTTTVLRYRYLNTGTGNYTAFQTLTDYSLNTSHSMTIPATQMLATSYEIQPAGSDAYTGYNSGDYYNFTVYPANFTVAVDSLGVYTFNEYGFPTPAGISLDGGLAQTTQQYVNTQGQSVYGVVFPKALATLGTHNLSAVDFASSSRSIQTTVNIASYPTFVSLTLRPRNSCVPASFRGSESFCNDTLSVINLTKIGATGAYCRFNPNECNLYNYSTGSCLLTAGQRTPPVSWIAYACYGNYNPTTVDISTPNTNGQVLTVGTGISGEGNTIPNSLVTLTAEQQLNLLAMIITILLTIGVGIVTRDVGTTGITFLAVVGLFTLISWLPVWFLIVEIVLASFLIAKFFRQSTTPQ
jgi:hypothetical protein